MENIWQALMSVFSYGVFLISIPEEQIRTLTLPSSSLYSPIGHHTLLYLPWKCLLNLPSCPHSLCLVSTFTTSSPGPAFHSWSIFKPNFILLPAWSLWNNKQNKAKSWEFHPLPDLKMSCKNTSVLFRTAADRLSYGSSLFTSELPTCSPLCYHHGDLLTFSSNKPCLSRILWAFEHRNPPPGGSSLTSA